MAKIEHWRVYCRISLAVLYGVAGVLHVTIPAPFLKITPVWVPDASHLILITGICEMAGAIGLLIRASRRTAGAALALYAICVFPANIKHAVGDLAGADSTYWQWLYHTIRLPLQPLLVWAALFGGYIVTWPFHRQVPKTEE